MHRFRPGLLQLIDHGLHGVDGLDQVGASALRDLDGHGGTAVDPRHRGRVLEGRLDLRHVGQRHRRLRGGDQRHFEDVLWLLEQRGHLHREATGLAFERARGDEGIEVLGDRAERVERHPVARQERRIENDLDCLVARPAQLR